MGDPKPERDTESDLDFIENSDPEDQLQTDHSLAAFKLAPALLTASNNLLKKFVGDRRVGSKFIKFRISFLSAKKRSR